MTFVVAHAGHVLVDILIYGSPVILGIVALKYADKKARAEDERAEDERADGEEPGRNGDAPEADASG